jgi:hypothetical protein
MRQYSLEIMMVEAYLALGDVEVEADIFVMRPLVDLGQETLATVYDQVHNLNLPWRRKDKS